MASTLEELAALVVKTGVGLAGLTQPQRGIALAVAAAALPHLPHGQTSSEAAVNAALKLCIAGPAQFLDTDHVELRRWLVDVGWWRRDGFGRAYERVPADELPRALCAIERALRGVDLGTWAAGQRAKWQARRDARRLAWQTRVSESQRG